LVQSAPNLLPMFGDVLFKNSDAAGADVVAERFEKMLPPHLQKDEDNPLPPQAQAVIAQAQQQVQLMQGELQKLTMERDAKVQEHQGKMQQIALQHQADMELEDKKLAVQVTIAEINTKAQSEEERQMFVQDVAKEVLKHQSKMESQHHAQAHELGMEGLKHMHSKDSAMHQAELASAQSAQDAAQSAQVSQ